MKSFWSVRPLDFSKVENIEAIEDIEKAKINKVIPVRQKSNGDNVTLGKDNEDGGDLQNDGQ